MEKKSSANSGAFFMVLRMRFLETQKPRLSGAFLF